MKLTITTYGDSDGELLLILEAITERLRQGDTEGYDLSGEDRYEWQLTEEDR